MFDISSLTSGLNPANLLGSQGGANALGGADPLALLTQLFSGAGASGQAQEQGSTCSCCSGGSEGACSCGCSCCQNNNDLGF